MCLERVTVNILKPAREERVGWKVFNEYGGDLHFENYPLNGKYEVRRGMWLKAGRETVYLGGPGVLWCGPQPTYTSGFHVFTTRKSARVWSDPREYNVIVKVRVRRVRTEGLQFYDGVPLLTLVCDEMFVPRAGVTPKTPRKKKARGR